MKRPERVAAVDKIEEKRKPEDFIGHRNRTLTVRGSMWVSTPTNAKRRKIYESNWGAMGALPVADEAT